MRLHRLAITGFGPFRDRQVVDFDALSDAGLFLLTGHTGAGKSSVLDAVTYALYGQVPGARASILRVRSDHADPSAPTVVELELTVRGTRLRVRRTPDWDRPRKRGDGTTRERGKVLLERLRAGSWEFVSARHDEVGHELAGLLGLTHDQFCQVVLLPQGAFAAFLGADAESRKRLLERLFGTERFSAVEGWLTSERAVRAEAFGQQLELRNELAARLADVADATDCPERDAADIGVLAWADAVLAHLGARRAAGAEALRVAVARGREHEAGLADAREMAARQQRLHGLLKRERALVAAEPLQRDAVTERAAATSAQALAPLLKTVDDLAETVAVAERDVEAGRDEVARFGVAVDGGAEALRAREREVRAEVTRLDDLLVDAARLTAVDAQLAAAQERVSASSAARAQHLAVLAEAPAQRARLAALLSAAELAAGRLPELGDRLGAAQARVQAAAVRDALRAERARAEEEHRSATDGVQQARADWLDLRERRLDGMAAELAAALVPGARCPVCGSPEHPRLATASSAVGEMAEQEARAALDVAESALQAASSRRQALVDKHAEARLGAGGDRDMADLLARTNDLASRRDAAQLGAERLPAARDALRAHEASTAASANGERAAQEVIRVERDRAAGLLADRTGVYGRVAAALGDDADLPTRVARLRAAADGLASLAVVVTDEAHGRRSLRAVERRLDREARAAGFDAAGVAASALRSDAQMQRLTRLIDAHSREAHLVGAGLAEPKLAGLVARDGADVQAVLTAAQRCLGIATATLASARTEFDRLDVAHAKALRRHGDLVGAVSRLGPRRTSFETADALSKLAVGTGADNRLRMRLSYYVLSARLEQVAAAASERLLRMSDGRFALRHTDERSAGNQRSGLGLLVSDSWYGTTRDPSTLSGGEAFMASLALALGLADVVVAEAGGTVMDTLFVDEGFGSLDDETLDAVLDVLDGLREGGRAVGLVSHVSDLRSRIPAQLAVRKAQQGSTVRLSA